MTEESQEWRETLDRAEEEFVAAITAGTALFGSVCSLYELCDHELCGASYSAFVAYEKARDRKEQT